MKVNVNYSVALEEVLPLVETLYGKNKKKFDDVFLPAIKDIGSVFIEERLQGSLLNIEELRRAMLEFDASLADITSILGGYQAIINQTNQDIIGDGEISNEL